MEHAPPILCDTSTQSVLPGAGSNRQPKTFFVLWHM